MQQPLPLNDRLARVAQHVIRARLFLDLWFYFEGADTRPHIIETMQDYSEFFRFTPHAYLATYVIYVVGAFDSRRDTISLTRLVPEVKRTQRLEGQGAEDLDALMARAEPLVEKIRTLRHKAFAHKDAYISYNDVFKLADMTPVQLRELTDIALEIANKLLLACGLRDEYFTELPREAAEQMMKALTKWSDHVEGLTTAEGVRRLR